MIVKTNITEKYHNLETFLQNLSLPINLGAFKSIILISEIQIVCLIIEIYFGHTPNINIHTSIDTQLLFLTTMFNLRWKSLYDYTTGSTLWQICFLTVIIVYISLPIIGIICLKIKGMTIPNFIYMWFRISLAHICIISFPIHSWLMHVLIMNFENGTFTKANIAIVIITCIILILDIIISIFIFIVYPRLKTNETAGVSKFTTEILNYSIKMTIDIFLVLPNNEAKEWCIIIGICIVSYIKVFLHQRYLYFYNLNLIIYISIIHGIIQAIVVTKPGYFIIMHITSTEENNTYLVVLILICFVGIKLNYNQVLMNINAQISNQEFLRKNDTLIQYSIIEQLFKVKMEQVHERKDPNSQELLLIAIIKEHYDLCEECEPSVTSYHKLREHILENIFIKARKKFKNYNLLNCSFIFFLLEEKQNIPKACFLLEKIRKECSSITDKILHQMISVIIDNTISRLESFKLTFKGTGSNSIYKNYNDRVNFVEYVKIEILFDKFCQKIQNDIENHRQFWEEVDLPRPDLVNLINIAEISKNNFRSIKALWNDYSMKIPTMFTLPYLIYGIFLLWVKNQTKNGQYYLQKYHYTMLQLDAAENIDELTKKSHFSSRNVTIMISGMHKMLGKIIGCTDSVELLLNFKPLELISQDISILMSNYFKTHHSRYLAKFFHSGIPNILGVNTSQYCVHRQGFLIPVMLNVSIFPIVDNHVAFIGILRGLTQQTQYLLVRDNGEIEGATQLLHEALGFPSEFKTKMLITQLFDINMFYLMNNIDCSINLENDQINFIGPKGSDRQGNIATKTSFDKLKIMRRETRKYSTKRRGGVAVNSISDLHKMKDIIRSEWEGKDAQSRIFPNSTKDSSLAQFQAFLDLVRKGEKVISFNSIKSSTEKSGIYTIDQNKTHNYTINVQTKTFSNTQSIHVFQLIKIPKPKSQRERLDKSRVINDNLEKSSVLTQPCIPTNRLKMSKKIQDDESISSEEMSVGSDKEIYDLNKLKDSIFMDLNTFNNKGFKSIHNKSYQSDHGTFRLNHGISTLNNNDNSKHMIDPVLLSKIQTRNHVNNNNNNNNNNEEESSSPYPLIAKNFNNTNNSQQMLRFNDNVFVKENDINTPKCFTKAYVNYVEKAKTMLNRRSNKPKELWYSNNHSLEDNDDSSNKEKELSRQHMYQHFQLNFKHLLKSNSNLPILKQGKLNTWFNFKNIYNLLSLKIKLYLFLIILFISIFGLFYFYFRYNQDMNYIIHQVDVAQATNQRLGNLVDIIRKLRLLWLTNMNYFKLDSLNNSSSDFIQSDNEYFLNEAFKISEKLIKNNIYIMSNIQTIQKNLQSYFNSEVALVTVDSLNLSIYDQNTLITINQYEVANQIYFYINRLNTTIQNITPYDTNLNYLLINGFNNILLAYENSTSILIDNSLTMLQTNIRWISLFIISISGLSMLILVFTCISLYQIYNRKRKILNNLVKIDSDKCIARYTKLNDFLIAIKEKWNYKKVINLYNLYHQKSLRSNSTKKEITNPSRNIKTRNTKNPNTLKLKMIILKCFFRIFLFFVLVTISFVVELAIIETYKINVNRVLKQIRISNQFYNEENYAITALYTYIGTNGTALSRNKLIDNQLSTSLTNIGKSENFLIYFEEIDGELNKDLNLILQKDLCQLLPSQSINVCTNLSDGAANSGLNSLNSYIYKTLQISRGNFDASSRQITDIINVLSSEYLQNFDKLLEEVLLPAYKYLNQVLFNGLLTVSSDYNNDQLTWFCCALIIIILMIIIIWLPAWNIMKNEKNCLYNLLELIPHEILDEAKIKKLFAKRFS